MNLALQYFKIYFLTTTRNIPALFFTLIFPPLMLLLFANQWDKNNSHMALIIFFNYSVQTVALMLLGMGVTQEKTSYWAKYLRTLPVGVFPMLMGRLLHTIALSLVNIVNLTFVALVILGFELTANQVLYLTFIALLGGIPMALMGITIGYLANPESSRSIFTLLNLLLLFGSFSLPSTGAFFFLREFVPTYQWAQLSNKVFDKSANVLPALLILAGYSILSMIFFIHTYKRQEKLKT